MDAVWEMSQVLRPVRRKNSAGKISTPRPRVRVEGSARKILRSMPAGLREYPGSLLNNAITLPFLKINRHPGPAHTIPAPAPAPTPVPERARAPRHIRLYAHPVSIKRRGPPRLRPNAPVIQPP